MLRKIPLGPFIELLTDLFDNGADFIDLSGEEDNGKETPRDTLKVTVRPEYLSPDINDDEEDDVIDHGMDFLIDNGNDKTPPSPLSKDDIDDLI